MGDNAISRMKYRGEAMAAAREGKDIADYDSWKGDQDRRLENTPSTKEVDLETGEAPKVKRDKRIEGMYAEHMKQRNASGRPAIPRETFYRIHK